MDQLDSETTLNFDLQKVLGTIPSQHSSHGREGDEIAVQIKKRVENAFSVFPSKETNRQELSAHESKIRKAAAERHLSVCCKKDSLSSASKRFSINSGEDHLGKETLL